MSKTGQQIFEMASALIYESVNADAESRAFTVPFLNIHLQECLAAENSIRRSRGETELTEAPFLSNLTTEINYHDAITRVALPYACAQHYYAEAMNTEMAAFYDQKYKTALSNACVATEEDIIDACASEE